MAFLPWKAGTLTASPRNGTARLKLLVHGVTRLDDTFSVKGGGISVNNGATGLIEDSYLHDYTTEIGGNGARFVTMRRIHVNHYSSVEFNLGTIILAEDSLFENVNVASGIRVLSIRDSGGLLRLLSARSS